VVPDDKELSAVLAEFARTMLTEFPIQGILDRLVERIVQVLPVSGAGVTLISEGSDPFYVAASDDAALRYEKLQTSISEGPCLAAFRTGQSISVPDIAQEERFQRFTPRAIEAGLVAVFAFPLRQGNREPVGALDLYRDTPGQLTDDSMSAAQTLADVAAAYILNAHARADLQEASDRFRESALHDPLTRLPNRVLFSQLVDHAAARAGRSGKELAILFVDLDRFKEVNDLFGHQVGDELLVAVATRLTALLRRGDTLARLAGDEFVILCEDFDEASHVEPLAQRIVAELDQPFLLSGHELHMTASIGIAFSGRGDDVPKRILHDADTAMYQVKRKGGAGHQILDLREQEQTDNHLSLGHDLRGAMSRGELRTDYQPIVDAGDGRITGVEALVRWSHPRRGMIAPALLIPIAEQSHLICEVGRWILQQACRDRNRWLANNPRHGDLGLSVNVSTYELLSCDYAATVAAVLAETGMAPDRLTVEVTESAFIGDPDRALVILNDLRDLGVRLALDDFGKGYSSLSYLQQFPVNVVKIDRSFVAKLGDDITSTMIVTAVVELAHALGMSVTAEGAETADQSHEVHSLGCESCQGFFFARPMSADDMDELLTSRSDDGVLVLPVPAGV
jgi:diguanylate cyclase (GGDEF)-like protein